MQLILNNLDSMAYGRLTEVVERKDIISAERANAMRCVDVAIDMGNIYGIRAVGAFGTLIIENYRNSKKVVLSNRSFGTASIT